jgi:endonuclease YncB( thermonuclease family)
MAGARKVHAMTAALLLCLIVGISDGDTLTARCEAQAGHGAVTLKVRLSEIDAPEKAQPFGTRSRQHLADLCFHKRAELEPVAAGGGLDRYSRTVARVTCEGADANAEQVRAGMAWVFDRYVIDRSLYDAQEGARSARRGLWQDEEPIAPWAWRQAHRH